jgi:hypothetical protein
VLGRGAQQLGDRLGRRGLCYVRRGDAVHTVETVGTVGGRVSYGTVAAGLAQRVEGLH